MTATKKAAAPKVKRGQVWRDRDKRQPGRWLVVRGLTPERDRAVCEVHERGRFFGDIHNTGRLTKVRLDRFRPTSTGYELVERIGDDGASS